MHIHRSSGSCTPSEQTLAEVLQAVGKANRGRWHGNHIQEGSCNAATNRNISDDLGRR